MNSTNLAKLTLACTRKSRSAPIMCSELFLLARKHNQNFVGVFKGFENVSFEHVRLIESEVVNSELQKLLFDVILTRNYTTREMESLINLIRRFHNKVKKKILRMIIRKKLHIETLPDMIRKFQRVCHPFNIKCQISFLNFFKTLQKIK